MSSDVRHVTKVQEFVYFMQIRSEFVHYCTKYCGSVNEWGFSLIFQFSPRNSRVRLCELEQPSVCTVSTSLLSVLLLFNDLFAKQNSQSAFYLSPMARR